MQAADKGFYGFLKDFFNWKNILYTCLERFWGSLDEKENTDLGHVSLHKFKLQKTPSN